MKKRVLSGNVVEIDQEIFKRTVADIVRDQLPIAKVPQPAVEIYKVGEAGTETPPEDGEE